MEQRKSKPKVPAESANQSVARALHILEALARAGAPVGVREIARSAGISPSIAQRLLATLADYGFAEQDAARKYGVGLRAFTVGNAFVAGNALAREALVEIQALAEQHQLNTYLGARRGRSVVYLLTCQSSGPIAIKSAPGEDTHLHSTALGKALLAELPEAEAERLLGREPYARPTLHTRLRFSALAPDLRSARRMGYAVSDEENLLGVYAVGAVVRDASGAAVAAISGALPRHEATPAHVPQLARLIGGAAERISRRLGAPIVRKAA
jgi:DNA-binding IclR family transcriptional regulator